MAQYLNLATLQEVSNENTAEQMVGQLVADFEQLAGELKAGIEAADQEGDDATSDLLTGMVSDVQKHTWMLNAFLGK
jgi:starvation-inducible DNA-binding protein